MSSIGGPSYEKLTFHPAISQLRYGIVYSEWNSAVTHALRDGAAELLQSLGVPAENIVLMDVSGAFELPMGTQYLADIAKVDGVIAIGCLIKGETPHFHYISEVVSHRLSELALQKNLPVGFGLLTVNTDEEATERAGGKHGNKGIEAAEAVVRLLSHSLELSQ